jgi:tetratricopeptide (TPR) repeat protein
MKRLLPLLAFLLLLDLSASNYGQLMKQGAAAAKKKDHAQALQKYAEAYSAAGNTDEKYKSLDEQARCLVAMKKTDQLKKLLEPELRKAEYSAPQKQHLLLRLASPFVWSKNYQYGLDKLNLALSIDGGVGINSVLYFSLCHHAALIYFHKKKEYEPVILLMEPLTQATEYDVNRITVFTMLANAYTQLGRKEDAARNYRQAIKIGKKMKKDTSKLEQLLNSLSE